MPKIMSRFNPYSIGSYSGSSLHPFCKHSKIGVSILILLEVTLEAIYCGQVEKVPKCFNPYSIGSYSGRL